LFFCGELGETRLKIASVLTRVNKSVIGLGQKIKKIQKKNLKIFREIFFPIFFGLSRFHIQFRACLRKFGGSRPAGLGGDRECTDST
jgi:hypothetical protein